MIGWIIGLGLPLLLAGGATAFLGPAPALALAARGGKGALGFLRSLTPRSWLVIAGVVLLVVGFIWHQRHAKAELQASYDAGVAAENARLTKKALQLQRKAEAIDARIVTLLRNQNHEENRRIAAGVSAWRLRGPGKAICTSVAGVPALSGGPDAASGAANAAVGRVSYPAWSDLIAMPQSGTAKFVEQHDFNRAEVISCRAAWAQLTAAREQLRAQSEKEKP